MDDIELFAKNEKELETLIHTLRICSQGHRNEFWQLGCAMLIMKSGKSHMTDGIELLNQEKIRTLREKETYKYLKILEADTKQEEMKEKIKKEYLGRTRKLLETKLYSKKRIKGINTWTVHLISYSEPFLKWVREVLKQMDRRTRKLMTMHTVLHPRDYVDRLYVLRKERGRVFASIEDSVDQSIPRLEDYIEKRRGRLSITNSGVMVIVVGNEHDDTSSRPGRDWLHFT